MDKIKVVGARLHNLKELDYFYKIMLSKNKFFFINKDKNIRL
jgi:hypothetical protein